MINKLPITLHILGVILRIFHLHGLQILDKSQVNVFEFATDEFLTEGRVTWRRLGSRLRVWARSPSVYSR